MNCMDMRGAWLEVSNLKVIGHWTIARLTLERESSIIERLIILLFHPVRHSTCTHRTRNSGNKQSAENQDND